MTAGRNITILIGAAGIVVGMAIHLAHLPMGRGIAAISAMGLALVLTGRNTGDD